MQLTSVEHLSSHVASQIPLHSGKLSHRPSIAEKMYFKKHNTQKSNISSGMKFCVLQIHFAFDEEFYILKCLNYLEKFGSYLQGSASKFKRAFTEKKNAHQCKVEHSRYTCWVHNYTREKKSIMVLQLMGRHHQEGLSTLTAKIQCFYHRHS